MATVYGILGQSAPAATTLTTSYTVPASKHTTLRVVACNRGGVSTTIRVAVSPDGASIADAHYIVYGLTLPANDSITTAPVTVGSTDVVRVYSTSGDVSFSVTGIEADD
jgi:hypothetical protein